MNKDTLEIILNYSTINYHFTPLFVCKEWYEIVTKKQTYKNIVLLFSFIKLFVIKCHTTEQSSINTLTSRICIDEDSFAIERFPLLDFEYENGWIKNEKPITIRQENYTKESLVFNEIFKTLKKYDFNCKISITTLNYYQYKDIIDNYELSKIRKWRRMLYDETSCGISITMQTLLDTNKKYSTFEKVIQDHIKNSIIKEEKQIYQRNNKTYICIFIMLIVFLYYFYKKLL